MKIRVADLWYGDYQAQLGACHVAERRLQDMVRRFGRADVKAFVEAWMRYGERRAIAEIRKLPKGSWRYATAHDPVPGIAEQGIPIRVTVSVDPARALVTVDARDNVDCVPGGLNLSEACATGACRIGVFNNLAADIPHNEGSASRIRVLLRDGCVVGRPRYPVGTSVATTNVNSRLITAVSCCFAGMGRPFGMGEIAYSQAAGEAVISGRDERRGRDYVNQIFVGYGGGPGVEGHDGWLLNGAACDGGQMALDSVEIDEGMYPMLIERRRIAEDSIGPGQWDGAPGVMGVYRPLEGSMLAIWGSDGDIGAPRGVAGGGAAQPSFNGKRGRDRKERRLPAFHEETCRSDEAIVFRSCGGGGYGDPRRRDPARVAAAVNRGWLSARRAAQVYGVVVRRDRRGDWVVDAAATRLRRSRRTADGRSSRAGAATGSR
jgi:N-methylhydantoinase B